MSRKPLSMFTALLVGLALSIPTSVSSQAPVEFSLAISIFAGFGPGEDVMFVYDSIGNRLPTDADGDPVTYTIVLVNTSRPDSTHACGAAFETEVAFTGISANYLKLSVVNDSTQLNVGEDTFQLDECFGDATAYVVGIGRIPAADGTIPRNRIFSNYHHIHVSVVDSLGGATRAGSGPFLMPIEDVFSSTGGGTVARGLDETLETFLRPRPGQAAASLIKATSLSLTVRPTPPVSRARRSFHSRRHLPPMWL